jgi:succinylglutamic semialdehyde dehydrogenase
MKNAIARAKKAFPLWSSKTPVERMEFLKQYKEALTSQKNTLAAIISEETGKPLWESKTEVEAMIGKIAISWQAYQERCPSKEDILGDSKLTTTFRPYGVVAVFGPFNFPGHLPNGHIIPSLIAGNTVIFKPSELTPKTGQALQKCFANLPEGVFQVIQGGPELGQEMVNDPRIDGIYFTGSAKTGMQISQQLSKTPGKILALEMGGNNPLVVSKIDDLKAASYITIQSSFLTAGQRCSSARRLILPREPTREPFLQELVRQIGALKIGPFTDVPEPFMGPLIHNKALDQLLEAQKRLIKRGAKPLHLMKRLYPGLPFATPALLDVTEVQDLPDEEHFGPFLQVIFVADIHEAIEVANQTQFGLTAGLLSTSVEEWRLFYQNVKAGIINWNTPTTGASSKAPFGGLKHSGNLRPSAYLAADYCSYPVAAQQMANIQLPQILTPGITLD